jgi:L-seryl-tRNA(Ser) seleniumtransferase
MAKYLIKTLRDFPSVEQLLQADELSDAMKLVPRPIAADAVKETVAHLKEEFRRLSEPLTLDSLYRAIGRRIETLAARKITPVINATGIVVHTNLGRAPLPTSIFDQIKQTVVGYGNVEFDMLSGSRGHRGEAAESYLAALAGSEAGTVVNNGAAALFVILNTLANRKKVLISRGELVQIGGGFRIPDILRRSGAKLAEVGTTNITSLADYDRAIDSQTALILKVHKSNFVQAGFTEEVPLKPLVALGKKHGLPVVNDLGSGVFVSTGKILGYHEPTVQESVRAGADLTCFSGDKMLGGVQAGLIVGREELVKRVKKNPIFRTVRVDKIVFSILEKLLSMYLDDTYLTDIRLWQVLATDRKELRKRADSVLKKAGKPAGVSIEDTPAYVGGGALPEQAIKSVGLVFSSKHKATHLMKAFRELRPPVIGRIDEDRFILDLKAIDPADLDYLARSIKRIIDDQPGGRA